MAITFACPTVGVDADSERKVYDALSTLSDDWTVLHSVAWQGPRGRRTGDGEADFVLIHRSHGIVVLEVKGGGVHVEAGRWKSRDRNEEVHDIKNPFEQAVASKAALGRFIAERFERRVPTCHAVWFPDLRELPLLGPDAPKAIALDAGHLTDAPSAIRDVVLHWRLSADLSFRQVQDIANALAPTVQVRRTLSDEAHDAKVRLVNLTEEQIRVLDMMRRNRRVVVFGGAGTGKTILACEKARQLHASGHRVLLTCYNKLLGQKLGDDPSLEGVAAHTFHALCMSTARQAGVEVPDAPQAEWWEKEVPYILVDAAERAGARFDAIIVDEGQDFSSLWLEALQTLCERGSDTPFLILADEDQKLWERDWDTPEGFVMIDLSMNCRNAQPIAERVAATTGATTLASGASGPKPRWTDLQPSQKPEKIVRRVVDRLLSENFERQDIVVLCETPSLRNRLLDMDVSDTVFCQYDADGIVTETIARFKGLESLAVVVVLDRPSGESPDRFAYVGFSRATSYLHVIANPDRKRDARWNRAPLSNENPVGLSP